MNKSALKSFATWSRRKLIEQVKTKAYVYGIDEKNGLQMEERFGQLVINETTYPLEQRAAFKSLQKQFEQKGYDQLMEEVAYTWFNRIIAIRYMEVHEFLPEKVNVLSSTVGRVDPDILFEYDTMDLAVDEVKVREKMDAGDTEAAFRLLFVAQCNALNPILPFMFEPIQDYTELLLPDFLLDAESVIKKLVQSDELTESFGEIEVIGWLYQYYIAEEKDRVFAQKSKYKKEEIPFATQLFTPKWIVQYMVQNSLGRYWTEAHREDEDLIDQWEYFIKHEEEDFHEKIAPYVNKELKVEDIKLLDPAMGSGHILVYAFEVFYEIYEKCGYPERDIPRLIVENNLYGLDIDDRANQLASFAVVMKATSYSKRFLRSVERDGITLNLASIQETNHISDDVIAYIAQQEEGERYDEVKAFFDQYYNAKTYGSLINITQRDVAFLEQRLEYIANNPVDDLFYGEQHDIAAQVLPALIHQTTIMRNEYDVVVMNPPYMGAGNMDKNLNEFMKTFYPNSKTDLFAAFMEIDFYLKENSFYTAINQHSWMFLSSYEQLRDKIIQTKSIDTMLHLGPRTFEEINGEVVQSTSFVLRYAKIPDFIAIYVRLINEKNHKDKESGFRKAISDKNNINIYKYKQSDFVKVPGYPLVYWIESKIGDLFKNAPNVSNIGKARLGLATGDNDRFMRFWYEVQNNKISFEMESREEAKKSLFKWFPMNKGGSYRKWYGNNIYIVNWKDDGKEIRNFKDSKGKLRSRPQNLEDCFVQGISWTVISAKSTFRFSPKGFLYNNKGPCVNTGNVDKDFILLGLLNSKVTEYFLQILSPGLGFEAGYISKVPVIIEENIEKEITES